MIASPASVPAIAEPVVRLRPWVSTNETTVTAAPSPMRQDERVPAGEQERDEDPDREREREGQRDERADPTPAGHRDRDEREERGPGRPMSGSRQRSMTEKVVVPSGWTSSATTTSSPIA